ncbi:serine protease [Microcoleus sp. PH2017_30_WIL_O_A]|uniref:serine protease n=1 Tax=Microcoleus sp. PH2017_30_WIL_O_A TaxID=2798840 RepID=UPI001DAF3D55|nr:serine protease [Microcoleus sp. PH2017_30_WIL_O_A]MCC3588086.1 trypsin-like peptidase domain-containing protein [Microcoleus sp. PH2017_30_WIL_O_A]
MDKSLEQLLQQCTVKLTVANIYGWGTGFFVAPGLILTCNHVVSGNANKAAEIGTQVQVRWQEQVTFAEAEVVKSVPNPYDLALLKFDHPKKGKLPCVRLSHNFASTDRLYLFGYPSPEEDHPDGCPVTVNCEGITGEKHIKLKLGQIQPGMSGSALLNQETGMVCGIVKFTLDRSMPLGGGAVQAVEILRLFPELKDLQRQFHQNDKQWKTFARKSATRGMYKLPERSINEQILLLKTSEEVVQRLGRSLYDAVWIDLGMQLQPDKVDCPFDAEIIIGPKPSQSLQSGTSIVDVFDRSEIAGKLLILGDAGSGKTTELSKLAETLLDRAEENINNPIPVFFSLASWQWNESIHNWMVREFVPRGVPNQVSKDLLKAGRVLPLLDGLDELEVTKQEACVNAINRFIENYEHQYLVVCCRKEAYENLDAKLQLNGAISLQSLSNQQIEAYLAEVGREELSEKLKESSKLLDLVRTPFLLSISVMAAQEISFEKWQKIETEKERLRYLLDAYVIRMSKRAERKPIWFHKKKEHEQNFIEKWIDSIDQQNLIEECQNRIENLLNLLDNKFYKESRKRNIKHYLIYLAKQLNRESKTEFLIEKLQPSWLPDIRCHMLYIATNTFILCCYSTPLIIFDSNLAILFLVSILYNSVISLLNINIKDKTPTQEFPDKILLIISCILAGWLTVLSLSGFSSNINTYVSLFVSLFVYLVAFVVLFWFFYASIGTIIALTGGVHYDIETVELMQWSLKDFLLGCVSCIATFLIFCSAISLIFFPIFFIISFIESGFDKIGVVLKSSLTAGGIFFFLGLPFISYLAVLFGLNVGLTSHEVEKKSLPNQGVKRSALIFIIVTPILAVVYRYITFFSFDIQIIFVNLFGGDADGLFRMQSGIRQVMLSCGLLFSLSSGIRFGGRTFIQHFSLRLLLWLFGLIPRNYARFLGYATERRFLQQAGGRYWFIHRFLQEHFAEMPLHKNVSR